MQQFRELFHAYREYYQARRNPSEHPVAARSLEHAASVAWHTFKAAFRGEARLSKEFLLQPDGDAVYSTIVSWVAQYAPHQVQETGDVASSPREPIADKSKCKARLGALTSESADATGPALWPYIESVKYGNASRHRLR